MTLNKYLALFHLAIVLTLSISVAAIADPSTNATVKIADFGFSRQVITSGSGPLYQFELPETIYKSIAFSDLRDIRVFNGNDQSIPYELSRPQAVTQATETSAQLSIFPIEGDQIGSGGQDSIEIVQSAAGRIRTVKVTNSRGNTQSKQPGSTPNVGAYLVDLRTFKAPLTRLDFDWTQGLSSGLTHVSVQSSDDLKHWSTVVNAAPLLKLRYGGETLSQTQVDLPLIQAKYLKVFSNSTDQFRIASLSGHFNATEVIRAKRNFSNAIGSLSDDEPGRYLFDLDGFLPVRSVRVILSGTNSLVRYTLSSRLDPKSGWGRRLSSTAYSLNVAGQNVLSGHENVGLASDRYWQLAIEGKEISVAGSPSLELGWDADRIVFLASGPPPYKLAFGNALAPKPDFGLYSIGQVNSGILKSDPSIAALGPQTELGGQSKLTRPVPIEPFPWRKWLLWAILLLTVLVIGRIALTLSRELTKS